MTTLYAIYVRGSDEILTTTLYKRLCAEEKCSIRWFNRIQGIYQRRGNATGVINKIRKHNPAIGETLYIKEFIEK